MANKILAGKCWLWKPLLFLGIIKTAKAMWPSSSHNQVCDSCFWGCQKASLQLSAAGWSLTACPKSEFPKGSQEEEKKQESLGRLIKNAAQTHAFWEEILGQPMFKSHKCILIQGGLIYRALSGCQTQLGKIFLRTISIMHLGSWKLKGWEICMCWIIFQSL